MAETTSKKFKKLNRLFGDVHVSIAHGNPIPESEYEEIEKKIITRKCYAIVIN